jgi:DNA-binding beta-propeller fold protein YncE
MILVLEDCDEDNKMSTAPYGDTAFLMNSNFELVRKFHGLNITGAFCAHRNISVSEDGRFFAVCESTPNMLAVYEMATGRKIWSLTGIFSSPVFVNELLYTINYESIFAIDNEGIIVKHARISAYDMTIDREHNCFWISGRDIKKCNLDLETVLTVKYFKGLKFPLFVEVNPDGSIWIAQDAYERYGRENMLIKISPEGEVLRTINLEFTPARVCIDKSDGSVWTTGMVKERDLSGIGDEMPETLDELNEHVKTNIETFTRKYDSDGNLIFEISEGGYAIELDPSDGSVWIADKKNLWHYSANGRNLASYSGVSDGQKWLAIVPCATLK